MKDIENTRKKIPEVLFWINLIFLAVAIFYSKKGLFVLNIIINILFLGSYFIIKKFGHVFQMILLTKNLGKFANKLNDLGGTK